MRCFVRFLKDRRAGVAPMLALGIIPLMGAVGAAIDYSRANSTRAAMQAAGDATALMLAKSASTLTSGQLQTNAVSYFNANFNRPEAQNLQITATYAQAQGGGYTIKVDSSAYVTTNFLAIWGYAQIPLTATGTVTWNNKKLRVALVLDNTGSMADYNKIGALKTASHNLLTQLQNAAVNDGDVYVSIVPFVKDVNAGASNYNATWIDWTDWDAKNGTCSKSGYHDHDSCVATGTCSNSNYTSQSSCQLHNKTWTWSTWTPKNHSTWNGCVTDRDQNYDTMNTDPSSGAKFPAEQYSACPTSVMGLTYDWTALNNKIDAMAANGNTNQAIGLAWGWQSLTNSPFTIPYEDPNYQYEHIIIILTDGLNTQDRWYSSASPIDNRQSITCNNIKNAGFTIYTVQVNTGGDPTSTLLQNCASDASKFFLLTSANEIITTFNTIGTSLQKLHLAK